ncbi:protein SPT2 homolog [Anopheles aquasalis]|uniref:protein SPT2 homolog n=1 Tax=Anopheles aquasalis TaxID=42839 RepID=UPI00215A7B52|nr:protein SPT2 homolog [Anopheles aquasalis]
MDFGKLLSVAKQNTSNDGQNAEGRYYSTKFAPPKKESKEKKLSDNIKKFLAKKEEEEREKALEARRKAEELMAKRDTKAKRKIEKMLKVIKSANKSVLSDAGGKLESGEPEQPDEDDYGYTSNVASHFYQQLMDKYKNNQEEKKFKDAEKRSMTKEDLAVTKARVKDAIIRQSKNEQTPRQRKAEGRSGIGCEGDNEGRRRFSGDPYDPIEERRQAEQAKVATAAEDKKRNAARKLSGPPPPDFATLLKLAEQKQHEPIKVEIPVEKKKQEPERLMTKKEKKEHEARVAFLEMKRLRDRIKEDPKLSPKEKEHKLAKLDALRAAGKLPGIPPSTTTSSTATVKSTPPSAGHVSQANGVSCSKPAQPTFSSKGGTSSAKPTLGQTNGISNKSTEQTNKKQEASLARKVPNQQQVLSSSTTSSASSSTVVKSKPSVVNIAAKKSSSSSITPSKTSKPAAPASSVNHNCPPKSQQLVSKVVGSSSRSNKPQQTASLMIPTVSKQPLTMNGKVADISSSMVSMAVKQAPKATIAGASAKNGESVGNLATNTARTPVATANRREAPRPGQTRQFPPADVQRSKQPRPNMDRGHPGHRSSGSAPKKRRVIDSDSEYDSEMDDFIDDGDCEEDYSSAIKEIFGYDKSRYRDDDNDEDDYNMESTYAQQMREEYISKKIGIMEDLEDMRMEEEEKRRKLKKGSGVKKK